MIMDKKISKVKILTILLVSIMFVGIVLGLINQAMKIDESMDIKVQNNSETVGIIDDDTIVTQTFTATDDFYGIALLMGTYSRMQIGKINIKITNNDTKKIVLDKSFSLMGMKDNMYFSVPFDKKVQIGSPTEFTIQISSKWNLFGSGVTIWNSGDNDYEDGELSVNGEKKNSDIAFAVLSSYSKEFQGGMFFKRFEIIVLIYIFILLNCIMNLASLYEFIYKKRVIIAFALLFFMVINKFNFSSINMWDSYVQQGEGSEYVDTVFGEPRAIRSDEWMVSLPRTMSAQYNDYGKYNNIVNARQSSNLGASGLYKGYSALAKPAEWGYYLFGMEYGMSFCWSFKMIFGFLFLFELCMLISRQKKILSVLGATLIWFSSYNMWWSTVTWVLTGSAAIVIFNYFVLEQTKIKKCLWGCLTAIAASNFVVDLYPAWQVPAGYVFLTLLIWIIVENWNTIRQYKWRDWLICALSGLFLISIVVVFLLNYKEYMFAIMNTKYPGSRISYGGFSLDKMFGYLYEWLISIFPGNYGNPCENGCFFTFFPLPLFLALYVLIKQKKKDRLLIMLLIPTFVIMWYCIFPMPKILAKILFLTYSFPNRAVDILGYVMVILLVIALSRMEDFEKERVYRWLIPLIILCIFLAIGYTYELGLDKGISVKCVILGICVCIMFSGVFLYEKYVCKKIAYVMLIITVMISGIKVHPLMVGTGAISSKPAAKEIKKIVEEDNTGKWIALDSVIGNYLIACGAPTINSVNYIPNLELWNTINEKKQIKKNTYDRYAHLSINLTNKNQSSANLIEEDTIKLNLSYRDLKKLNIKYVVSNEPIEDYINDFNEIYDEYGFYIYEYVK